MEIGSKWMVQLKGCVAGALRKKIALGEILPAFSVPIGIIVSNKAGVCY